MGQIVGIAIVWFIIEMLLWYLLAQFMSGWWVFMWFIIAAVIGISLMRKGMAALNPMAQQMKAGGMMNPAMRPQESTMIKSVAMAAAGILLGNQLSGLKYLTDRGVICKVNIVMLKGINDEHIEDINKLLELNYSQKQVIEFL